jgi:hypothetical protein
MRVVRALGVGSLLIVISITLLHLKTRHPFCTVPRPHFQSVPDKHHRKLHLLLPVDEGSAKSGPEFCKTLLSALVHGYEPIILNWDREGDREFMQRMKVFGMQYNLRAFRMQPDGKH